MERPSAAPGSGGGGGGGELRAITTQVSDTHAKCNETLNLLTGVVDYYEGLKGTECRLQL